VVWLYSRSGKVQEIRVEDGEIEEFIVKELALMHQSWIDEVD
jgi:hypothetical protein